MPERPGQQRRTYLDVLRGLAVLVMIEAHIIDSWTRVADRRATAFGVSLIIGGFGAPLFLFLAGVAVPLSAGSKARRLGDAHAAARLVERRGFEIFLLAFLFRLQAVILSRSPLWTLLKVDVLNIMGPAIMGAALLWSLCRSSRARIAAFAAATAAIALFTPIVRDMAWLGALPPYVQGYIRPVPGWTNFTFFPWAGFVAAGAIIGTLLDDARSAGAEWRLNFGLALAGLLLAAGGYGASFLPSPYHSSSFWTSSPCFFFLRAGVMTLSVALAYTWERRASAGRRWSPMRLLGRSSLFIYWIHVEMVYGLISLPLHGALPLGGSWTALVVFSAFMVVCALLKDRVKQIWRERPMGGSVARHSSAV
ncbi:MAG: heparan-alpha-glucosaminide N-acetyltransferase domain-containing protein [Vicinamibacterales bacterium]